MIIRSQDKKRITDDMKLHIYVNDFIKDNPKWQVHTSSHDCIGIYYTEEKAIKVLDMITEEYGKHLYGQGGQMATADYYVPPFAFIPPKVFQMPQDSEVTP